MANSIKDTYYLVTYRDPKDGQTISLKAKKASAAAGASVASVVAAGAGWASVAWGAASCVVGAAEGAATGVQAEPNSVANTTMASTKRILLIVWNFTVSSLTIKTMALS